MKHETREVDVRLIHMIAIVLLSETFWGKQLVTVIPNPNPATDIVIPSPVSTTRNDDAIANMKR